jgi:hypothetical protein
MCACSIEGVIVRSLLLSRTKIVRSMDILSFRVVDADVLWLERKTTKKKMTGHKFPTVTVQGTIQEWMVPLIEKMCGVKLTIISREEFEGLEDGTLTPKDIGNGKEV